jgi:uncharacterized protein DUF6263
MLTKHFLYALSFISILSVPPACQTYVDLSPEAFSFNPAEGMIYDVTTNTVRTTSWAGNSRKDTTVFDFSMALRRKDTVKSEVIFTINKLHLSHAPGKIVIGGKNMDMTDYFEQRNLIFENIRGQSLVLFLDQKGNLLMEDRLDSLITNVSRKSNSDPTNVRRTVRDFLSASSMKDMMSMIFFYLPARVVKSGDSWVNNVIYTAMAPVKHSNLMKIDTITGASITIKIDTRITAGEMSEVYLKGTRTGQVIADPSSGFPKSMMLSEETSTKTGGGNVDTKTVTTISAQVRGAVNQ